MINFKNVLYVLILMGIEAPLAFSADQPNYLTPFIHDVFNAESYRPVMTLTLGPDFVEVGEVQNLILLPPFYNHYTVTHSSQRVIDVGVFLGVEHVITPWLSTQLGISGYKNEQMSPQGKVWQFGDPKFEDLGYQYHIQHSRIVFTNKLITLIPNYPAFHPYFSWEAGIAFNKAKDYNEYPLIPLAFPTPPFTDHTENSFTWAVGAGIDYDINAHMRVGLGYQFADLGSVSLGIISVAPAAQVLSLSHMYTNQLHFQLTILA